MSNLFSKAVLGVSLISSVGTAALVSADMPVEYKVVSDKLSAEEECMEACALLGKDFDNLDYQNKVRDAFAKVKKYQDVCKDYFYNKQGDPFGEFKVYGKYPDLENRLHSLKAPWWAWEKRWCDVFDSPGRMIVSLVRTKSQEKALEFIIKLDQEGPNATHMNLWYS